MEFTSEMFMLTKLLRSAMKSCAFFLQRNDSSVPKGMENFPKI